MEEHKKLQYTAEERDALYSAAMARIEKTRAEKEAQSAADFAIATERIGLAGNNREASRLLWEFANTQVNTQGYCETFTPYEELIEVVNNMLTVLQRDAE